MSLIRTADLAKQYVMGSTVVHALRRRPIAVAGKGGAYIVDPIDPHE